MPKIEFIMQEKALIVFIKNAELGKVKTRLAADIGDKMALEVYQELLKLTLNATKPLSCSKYVFYSDKIEAADMWAAQAFQQFVQKGKDLGERIHNAFEAIQALGHEQIVLIGSDLPQINAELIQLAFDKLDKFDAVIGPAKDGGYYLLGLKHIAPQLFQNKKWSTSSVFSNTIQDFADLNWKKHSLEVLSDVDCLEDLIHLPAPISVK